VFWAILIIVVVSGLFLWSVIDAARRPSRYEAAFNDAARWRRLQAWTWAITVAAVVGSWVAGARTDTLLLIVFAGSIVNWVAPRFIDQANLNRWRRKFFGG
jgi:hypothetical protein